VKTTKKISRREFMRLTTIATAGMVAAACTSVQSPVAEQVEEQAPEPAKAVVAEEKEEVMPAGQYNEAPMLADLVKAGELPPVDQRLPANPTTVPVVDRVGVYGGTIRRAFKGVSDRWGPSKVQDSSLIRYELDLSKHPDLIESWEYNEMPPKSSSTCARV
jgi:ABC-type transport system substrate-binding protein